MFGCMLMVGYLGFDGFTSTWQDRMFKGYSMSVYNQILYVQLCSACVSFTSLIAFGQVCIGPCSSHAQLLPQHLLSLRMLLCVRHFISSCLL